MTVVYVAIMHPPKGQPYSAEVLRDHCDPSHIIAAQDAAEHAGHFDDPGLDRWMRWQVIEVDLVAPGNTRDVTADAICALVAQYRAHKLCTDCPPWWQGYDATLADYELAGWDHERAAEEARADLDEHRRAAIAATGYPFGAR